MNWNISIDPIELVATLTGVLSVFFSYKKNILTYFFGLISVSIYVFICWNAGIYAEMGINIFYFMMSIYGWVNWHKLFKQNSSFTAIRLRPTLNVIFIFLTAIMWIVIYFILIKFTNSTVPILDSLTTSFFITGMTLMTIRSIENWIYLIIGNLITIPLFIHKELYISAVFYLVLTLFAILGWKSWSKSLKWN